MQACVNNIYPACPKALTILLSILPVSWLLNDLQHLAMALLRQLGNLRKLIYVKMWKTRLRSKLDTRLLHQPSMWRNHTVSLPITKIVYNDSRLSFDNIPPATQYLNFVAYVPILTCLYNWVFCGLFFCGPSIITSTSYWPPVTT